MGEFVRFTWWVDEELLQFIKHQAVNEKKTASTLLTEIVVKDLKKKGINADEYGGDVKGRVRGRKKREAEGLEGVEERN